MIDLETEKLLIRNYRVDDWKDLAELGMKYEETDLAKYDEGPWPDDLEVYKGMVQDLAKSDDFLAVVLKETKKLVGLIYKAAKENKKYEFGFNFNTDYQGKGYASESCKVVVDYIFDILKANLITAGTAKVNAPSNKLLLKLGFKQVGEKTIAFRKDENGNPIEFEALDYVLKQEDWLNFINSNSKKSKKEKKHIDELI